MRKKTILSLGGLTLAVGVGIAAFSGATLPLAFSAVATADEGEAGNVTTVEKVLEVKETTPITGSTIAFWQLPDKFQVQFTNPDAPGTWDGLTGINPDCTESIQIGKANMQATGPNTYFTNWKDIPAEAVAINAKNPNIAEIDRAKVQEVLGNWDLDDNEYWIKVPAGYFLGGQTSETTGTEDNPNTTVTKWVSPECGIGFILNNSPKYTTNPVSGATLQSNKDGLNTITVTFPTDVVPAIPWDGGSQAELYYCDPTASNLEARAKKGTYKTSIDGNVVTLTLELDPGITSLPLAPASKVQYYEVVIPQGLVQCTDKADNWLGNSVGSTITNLKYEYKFDASDVKLLDEDGEEITSLSTKDFTPATSGTAKDGTCFYLEFPCEITYTGTAYSAAYLYMGTMTTPSFASFYISVEGKNTVKLQMKNPQASSVVNHPELWYNADNYNFGIPANVIQIVGETAKLPATRFKNFEMTDGVTSFGITLTGINNSANALPDYANQLVPSSEPLDGQNPTFYVQSQTEKETKVAPADFGAIKSEVGVSYLQFTSPVTFGLNPATEGKAKISLVKVGQEEPIWSQTNEGKVNVGHLFKGRATRTLINTSIAGGETGTTTSWYFYNDFEKNADGGYVYSVTKSMTAANVNKTSYYGSAYATPEFITEPGEYKYIIDEGFFVSAVTGCPAIPSAYTEIPFTIVGEDAKVEYTVTPESGSDVSALSTVVFEYPEGATIQLSDGAKAEVRTYSSFLNEMNDNPMASYPMTISAEGNKVTLSLATPLTQVLQAAYVVKVPGAAWTIQVDGKAIANESAALKYYINKLGQGTMVPAPTAEGETIAAADLQNPVYTSLMPVYDHNAVSTVGNLALCKVSYEEVDGVKTLVKGAQVATYTWTGSGNSAESQTECAFTAASGFDANELASGLYAIYIPTDYFKYKGFTTTPQDKDFVFVYNVKGSVATEFTRSFPASATVTWTNNGYRGLDQIAWTWKGDYKFNDKCTQPVVLTRNGVKVGEAPVATNIEAYSGEIMFMFNPVNDANLMADGTYKVEVPAGLFTLNGEDVPAFFKAYTYTYNKRTPNFTYTLTPAVEFDEDGNEIPVESLEEITLTFTTCYDIDYAGKIATLTSEDGSIVLTQNYPKIVSNSTSSQSLVFKFGNANTKWKSGKYTLKIEANNIALEEPQLAGELEAGEGNFEGLEVTYDLNYVAPYEFLEHATLSHPGSYEVNESNSSMPGLGTFGVGLIDFKLDVKEQAIARVEGAEFISIAYSATQDGNYEVIKTLNPNAPDQVMIMSQAMFDDANIAGQCFMTLNFGGIGTDDFDYDDFDGAYAPYTKTGYYKVVIPDGAFTFGGVPVNGTTLNFTYGVKGVDFTYTLTPANGSTIADVWNLMLPSKSNPIADPEGIVVKFPGAQVVDVMDGGVTLTAPSGAVADGHYYFKGNRYGELNYVGFRFPISKWEIGAYTFKVDAGILSVDRLLDDGDKGNGPEIVATYYVDNNSTLGLVLIGIEAADSYTVYTLDGKVVKVNATIEQLRELENGLYIINGKKAMLRK